QEILTLIQNQINALHARDFNKAYYNFTSPQFRQTTSFEEFKYFIESFPHLNKNKNALFGNLESKPDGVTSIQGTVTSQEGETLKVEYDFIKEGNEWKILGIKLFRPTSGPEPSAPSPQIGPNPTAYYDFQQDIE